MEEERENLERTERSSQMFDSLRVFKTRTTLPTQTRGTMETRQHPVPDQIQRKGRVESIQVETRPEHHGDLRASRSRPREHRG